jgi:hypothetical protein
LSIDELAQIAASGKGHVIFNDEETFADEEYKEEEGGSYARGSERPGCSCADKFADGRGRIVTIALRGVRSLRIAALNLASGPVRVRRLQDRSVVVQS